MSNEQLLIVNFLTTITAIVVTVAGCWGLSRFGPRGSAMVVASSLFAVGYFLSQFNRPDLSSGLGRLLCFMGFIGVILGTFELFRRRSPAPASTSDTDSSSIAPPMSLGSTAPCPRPGLWASVSWCLVLIVIVKLLPGTITNVIGSPDTQTRTTANQVLFGPMAFPGGSGVTVTHVGANVGSAQYSFVLAVVTAMAYALAITIGYLLVGREFGPDWRRMLGLRWPGTACVLTAFVGAIALWVMVDWLCAVAAFDLNLRGFSIELAKYVHPETLRGIGLKWPLPVVFTLLVAAPVITQELWFRGFIGRALVTRFGTAIGVLLTSGLCALAQIDISSLGSTLQIDIWQAVFAFFTGIALHLAYLTTRSLLVPIMIHMTTDLTTTLLVRGANSYHPRMQSTALGFVAGLIVFLLAGVLLYRMAQKRDD